MTMTQLGYLAVKRQSTERTAVKPTNFIRFKDGDLENTQDNIINNPIQNNRWGAKNIVKGKITAGGTFNMDLDANEAVHFLGAGMGGLASSDVSSEEDSSVIQHILTLTTALPALSVEQAKGNLADSTNNLQNYLVKRAFGAFVDQFTITSNDGIVNLQVVLKALGIFEKATLLANAAAGSSVALSLDTVEGLVTTTDTVSIYDTTPQNETDAIASLSTSARTVTIATLGNSYTVANKAKVELVPQSPSYGTAPQLFAFHNVNFQFGADLTAAASASEENVENREFTYMNNIEERYGSLGRG